MLRIFVFDEPFTLKLRLEGDLDRGSLPKYEEAMASARAGSASRKLLVDVRDLNLADAAAEEAIRSASRAGIHFVAAAGQFAELLHDQERSECQQTCRFLRRVAFSLTDHCRSSVRPVCMKLYRLLHGEN